MMRRIVIALLALLGCTACSPTFADIAYRIEGSSMRVSLGGNFRHFEDRIIVTCWQEAHPELSWQTSAGDARRLASGVGVHCTQYDEDGTHAPEQEGS